MEATTDRLLDIAAEQFAEKGYAGASMRSIADATGITQAAIYHHYSNKDALYEAALSRHLHQSAGDLLTDLSTDEEPEQKFRAFVRGMLTLADEDARFRQLYLRELMEGDTNRLKTLAQVIHSGIIDSISEFMQRLAPDLDPQLLTISVTGLACHHIEARKLYPFLPDIPPEHQELDVLAEHITQLLLYGAKGK